MALEAVLISSPFSIKIRNLLPINAGTSNFGEINAVASPYVNGRTVGKVETAPLHIEYGKGHNRIMQSNLSPSYFKVKESAANLLSCSMRRATSLDRIVRDTIKEEIEPRTVALAYRNQLQFQKEKEHQYSPWEECRETIG